MKKNENGNKKVGFTRREVLGISAGAAAALVCNLSLPQTVFAAKKKKIGFAMETFTVPRWKYLDKARFEEAVSSAGFEPIVNQANFDVAQQMRDVENLLTQGVEALAIVAVVAEAGINMVRRAKSQGVPVLAYNTAIPSSDVAVYVARDNFSVGKKAVEAARDLGVLKGNWVICSGQAGNTVAEEITKGYLAELKPQIDDGTVKIFSHLFHDGWDPEKARRQAEDALTATKNNIQGFLCNNDGMAGGVIAALEPEGLAGKVFVSGQDATTEACRQIIEGKMNLSSFTRFDVMGETSGKLCVKLAKGEKIDTEKVYEVNGIKIPYVPIEDFNVTKNNIVEYISQYSPGYVDAQAIFKDIPKTMWPKGAEELLK
jgi:D-xylose transport system substrate-binding protein